MGVRWWIKKGSGLCWDKEGGVYIVNECGLLFNEVGRCDLRGVGDG